MKALYLASSLLTMSLGCGWGSTGTQPPAARWVRVSVSAPGFSASEIERDITPLVEASLVTLPNVQWVQSVSYPNEMVLWSQCDAATDPQAAMHEIGNALNSMNDWPDDAHEPQLRIVPRGPVLLLALHHQAGDHDLDSVLMMSEIASRLKPLTTRIPHVADVSVLGETNMRCEISVDQDKARAFEINSDKLEGILQQQFLQMPQLRADKDSLIRIMNEIPIREGSDGQVTMLEAVADVHLRVVEPSGIPLLPSRETWPPGWILLGIHVDSAANADACSEAVQQMLASFSLPDGVEIIRDLDSHPAQIKTLAGVAWSRTIPPDTQLRHATSTAWHSYFALATPDFLCRVTGPDISELRRIATEVRDQVRRFPKVTAAHIDGGATQPELRIEIDPDKTAALGVSEYAVKRAARSIPIGPRRIASVEVKGSNEEVRAKWADVVLLPDDNNPSLDGDYLSTFRIQVGENSVPLEQLCRLSVSEEPTEIRHDQLRRCVDIRVTTSEHSASIQRGIRSRLSDYNKRLKSTNRKYQMELIAGE